MLFSQGSIRISLAFILDPALQKGGWPALMTGASRVKAHQLWASGPPSLVAADHLDIRIGDVLDDLVDHLGGRFVIILIDRLEDLLFCWAMMG